MSHSNNSNIIISPKQQKKQVRFVEEVDNSDQEARSARGAARRKEMKQRKQKRQSEQRVKAWRVIRTCSISQLTQVGVDSNNAYFRVHLVEFLLAMGCPILIKNEQQQGCSSEEDGGIVEDGRLKQMLKWFQAAKAFQKPNLKRARDCLNKVCRSRDFKKAFRASFKQTPAIIVASNSDPPIHQEPLSMAASHLPSLFAENSTTMVSYDAPARANVKVSRTIPTTSSPQSPRGLPVKTKTLVSPQPAVEEWNPVSPLSDDDDDDQDDKPHKVKAAANKLERE